MAAIAIAVIAEASPDRDWRVRAPPNIARVQGKARQWRRWRRRAQRLTGRWVVPPLLLALRLTRRRVGLALMYHTIAGRQGDPSHELLPALEERAFRRQLGHLRRHYEVVPADNFLAAIAARHRGGRFPVCLTFDDDVPEHVRNALPALREQGMAATFFLCGSFLDEQQCCFWWQRLQRAFDRGATGEQVRRLLPAGPPPRLAGTQADIHTIGIAAEALTPAQRDEFAERVLALAGPDRPGALLDRSGAAELGREATAIGFHTRRHDPLPALPDDLLEQALRLGASELSELAGRPLTTIAYPHGRADRRVADAARRAGFELGFTDEPVATAPGTDPLLVGRYSPGGGSLGEFATAVLSHLLLSR